MEHRRKPRELDEITEDKPSKWEVMFVGLIFILLMFLALTLQAEAQVIETIVYESSGESLKAQIAVASVIKTRMKERRQTAIEVVLADKQFSCWKDGLPTQSRRITTKERKQAQLAWDMAEVGEYNHYAHYRVSNYWIRKAKKIIRIGLHNFYKLN